MTEFVIYLILVNIISYYFMKSDKKRSRQSRYRFSERVFFIVALIGGSVGVLVGMYRHRHKTHKIYFVIGIPLILFLQVFFFLLYIMK
jgi:uncharacterized membrane protein YsdA (DUF1294 family)